jgi:hypothetical protein
MSTRTAKRPRQKLAQKAGPKTAIEAAVPFAALAGLKDGNPKVKASSDFKSNRINNSIT